MWREFGSWEDELPTGQLNAQKASVRSASWTSPDGGVARLWPDFDSKLRLGCLRRGSAVGSLTWWPENSIWPQAHGG
jgi:hypothetical protein